MNHRIKKLRMDRVTNPQIKERKKGTEPKTSDIVSTTIVLSPNIILIITFNHAKTRSVRIEELQWANKTHVLISKTNPG